MALGKIDGVSDTNIGKASALTSTNIGKIGGNSYSSIVYDSYTKLMLHMDGSNGSTTFIDEIGKTVTPHGDAKISTAQSKFSQSGLFDGNGDYLTIPDNADFAFGSGDFTIDFWVRFTSLNSSPANYPCFIDKMDLSSGTDDSFFLRQDSAEKTITFYYTTGGTWATAKGSSRTFDPSLDTWYHIAIVRNGSNLITFINGIQSGTAYNIGTDSIWTSSRQLMIGACTVNEAISYPFNGYIDELRISKGIARWTSNFIVPTVSYPNSSTIGIFGGAYHGGFINLIDYINISTTGNASDFGDLSRSDAIIGTCSSSTRGLFGGGYTGSGTTDTIDYITIALLVNATDFGNLSQSRSHLSGCSSSTRGLFGGGGYPTLYNIIDYVTIASTGNAQDFGDLTLTRRSDGAFSSSTRGIFAGGCTSDSGGSVNIIDYVTIASTGNAQDFGDLTQARDSICGGVSSGTRGIIGGGYRGDDLYVGENIIDYITIATLGNAADFGDLTLARFSLGNLSSTTRGIFGGGAHSGSEYNTIDYITIASTGNASDFGDLVSVRSGCAGLSDCHGGLV